MDYPETLWHEINNNTREWYFSLKDMKPVIYCDSAETIGKEDLDTISGMKDKMVGLSTLVQEYNGHAEKRHRLTMYIQCNVQYISRVFREFNGNVLPENATSI